MCECGVFSAPAAKLSPNIDDAAVLLFERGQISKEGKARDR